MKKNDIPPSEARGGMSLPHLGPPNLPEGPRGGKPIPTLASLGGI